MAADYLVPWLNASGGDGTRNSMLVAPGDGVTTMYSLNFAGGYISKDNIKAYTFNPATGVTTVLTITSGMWTGPQQITLTAPVPVGQFIVIYRDTPKDTPLVSFTNGSIMNEPNLDELAEQAVFVAAEMADRFNLLNDGSTLAIQNSATALATANTALAQAGQAVSTANAASTQAASAASQASSAVSTANAANATANGINAKAQTALDNSAAAVTTANAAATTANGINSKAQTALDQSSAAVTTANAASTNAGTALSTANSVSTKADNAVSTANTAAAQLANAVLKSGSTMTGDLYLRATATASPWVHFYADGYLAGHIRMAQTSGFEFYNSDFTARNMNLDNSGNMNLRGSFGAGGNIAASGSISSAAGISSFQGGINVWNGLGVQSGNLVLTTGALTSQTGTSLYGDTYFRNNGNPGQIRLFSSDGTQCVFRGRASGAGFELINNAYSAVLWAVDDSGTLTMNYGALNVAGTATANNVIAKGTVFSGNGAASFGSDGNIVGAALPGGNLVTALASKAAAGAQVQWASGISELAGVVTGADITVDAGGPWVLEGLRTVGGSSRIYMRVVWLRNQ
jgi:hypothetical protein